MILTEDEILNKSHDYSIAHSKDRLQRLCLQQGYADGWADCQQNFCKPDVVRCKEVLEQKLKEAEKVYQLGREPNEETWVLNKKLQNVQAIKHVLKLLEEPPAL